MVPSFYVVQSHCLFGGTFESAKLFSANFRRDGKCIRSVSDKMSVNWKAIYGQLGKPIRRISYNHHTLKASETSNVTVSETLETVAMYRFMMETGGQLKVLVQKKHNKEYQLYVEVESFQVTEVVREVVMVWGLFRANSNKLILSGCKESSADGKNGTTETPFDTNSVGRLATKLVFGESIAPFYVSFLLMFQLGNGSVTSTIRSHRKTNFVVPVGFGSGRPSPKGISLLNDGSANFAFFSRDAGNVVLCLYADNNDKPTLEIDLDPYVNRSGHIWHASIDCSVPFVSYGYRCIRDDNKGHRVLLDPYAKIIEELGMGVKGKYLGRICKEPPFDWSGDCRPNLPMEKMIIYKLNVARYTKDDSSKLPSDVAGTFSGISEKLHHIIGLGVNAVLLEPIFPFDEQKGPYFPWHFFSPGSLYGHAGHPKTVAESMKEMVKKLHANGIEVLLEVVFTHTCEDSPLAEIDPFSYLGIKGAKDVKLRNVLNSNHPIVQEMILESLRYWVIDFHVDGFCFINASSLLKDSRGVSLSRPPLIEAIAFDPVLSKVKVIADTWDPHDMETKEAVFPHWKRWAEMNARFSVDVRNFLRGEGPLSNLATRLCGSGDLFSAGRGPSFSFNFITRNVGLTLVDLVSFSCNELESELSWNCGEEGPTSNTVVLERRLKQIRNFLFILFISLGIPVLNMGDEFGVSSGGSVSYADRKPLDWNAMKSSFGLQITRFISFLSSLKARRSDLLQRNSFLEEERIDWCGSNLSLPTWDDPSCRFLAMTLKSSVPPNQSISESQNVSGDLFVAFNGANQLEEVALPPLSTGEKWVRLVDTALPFPGFFTMDGVPLDPEKVTYGMKSYSCVFFEARNLG